MPTATIGFPQIIGQESGNPRAFGYGGIAYHLVADNYIALFSHFIPCVFWLL